MPEAAAQTPPRQARSRATHTRLLDATIRTLIAKGYAATTTTEVCRRAGVSQGALFKHFPSKARLLAATVEHLFARLVRDYHKALSRVGERDDDRIRAAIELLWETFNAPALHAAFELMLAGRTDAELRAALVPVQAQHSENLREAARQLFPEAAARDPQGFDAGLDTILSAMQGASLGRLTRDDPEADRRRLAFLEATARRLIAPEEV